MDFDLAEIDTRTAANDGVWLPLMRVDGSPLTVRDEPVRVRLLGQDSDAYRQRMREHLRRRLERRAAGDIAPTLDDLDRAEQEGNEILAACTADWSGVYSLSGDKIRCSFDAALALYQRFPVIREQVDRFVANRANFIAASSRA
jgi:hypothetical protein